MTQNPPTRPTALDPVLWVSIAAMVVMGFIQGCIGPALDGFRGVLDGAAPGWVVPTLGAFSILVGVLIAPPIDHQFGQRPMLLASSIISALGIGLMATAHSAIGLLVGLALFDLGFGIAANGFNTLLAEDTALNPTRALGFGNAMFGVGILAAPMIYASLSGGDHLVFRPALWMSVALYIAVMGFTIVGVRGSHAGKHLSVEAASSRAEPMHVSRGLVFIALGLICSGVAESVFGSFFEDQLHVLGRVTTAPWKSGFWAMYTLGRFIVGALGPRVRSRYLLMGFLVWGFVGSVVGVLTSSPLPLVAIGMSMGASFPLSVAMGNEQGAAGKERTALLTVGLVGGTLGPLMFGPLMESPGRRTLAAIGMVVYVAFTLVTIAGAQGGSMRARLVRSVRPVQPTGAASHDG
jgi:MFS family permease